MKTIQSRHDIKLGVVPTHVQFLKGLVPNESGNMPRDSDNKLTVVAAMERLAELAQVRIDCVQISLFPGVVESDLQELVEGIQTLGMEVHFILMVGGAGNPMDPADESAVIDCIVPLLQAADRYGIRTVSSTSVEQWMQPGAVRKEGSEFQAAVEQNVVVHTKACEAAGIDELSIDSWHIEFLRNVEFSTFTDLHRAWQFVSQANKTFGKPFFKVLIDAAHCGDSGLSLDTNIDLIQQIAANDELGIFHASAKTTRGCHSTDDGWIGALLSACAGTGKLKYVFTEMFHHEDEALQPLRDAVKGHGVDTTDGRSYDQVVAESLNQLGRRLNNFANRGITPAKSVV